MGCRHWYVHAPDASVRQPERRAALRLLPARRLGSAVTQVRWAQEPEAVRPVQGPGPESQPQGQR
jgi:hypothetical protein